MLSDLKFALRSLLKYPTFSFMVAGTIALGLGVNTALFTVFNACVLRPLEVRDPYSLYQIGWFTHGGYALTAADARLIQGPSKTLSETLWAETAFTKTAGRSLAGKRVSGNYFSLLGVDAVMGRPLTVDDALPASEPVVVLSNQAWKAKFGADAGILGKRLPMFGASYEVIGVARPGFNGLGPGGSDFWIAQPTADEHRLSSPVAVIGRLKPGVTRAQAEAEMLARARQLTADRPELQRSMGVRMRSSATTVPPAPEVIALFTPVAVAFVLILLIACANVANMMLARSLERQREIGVRLALGAGRLRLIRQLLTESVVLGVPTAAFGFVVSEIVLRSMERLLVAIVPPFLSELTHRLELSPDMRVFFFLLTVAVVSTLAVGLIPAIRATRLGVNTAIGGNFVNGSKPSRSRSALVVCQVTGSVLLLICTGILLQTSRQLSMRDPGFDMRGVFGIHLNEPVQPRIARELASEPWVESIATAEYSPLTGKAGRLLATAQNQARFSQLAYNFVSPGYFSLLRIPIVRGRNFTAQEAAAESGVVVISEATAQLLWPHEDALGQSIRLADSGHGGLVENKPPAFRTAQVIGVAKDIISDFVWEGMDKSYLYFPTGVQGEHRGALLVRANADTQTARRALDALLERVAPTAVKWVVPLDEFFAMQVWPFQLGFLIAAFLGGLALLLTLSGIYGVLSYLVTQRTREIGVRMALGATTTAVVRGVLSRALFLAFIGILFGTVCSLGVSRLLASWLAEFNINALDAIAYLVGMAVVLAAAGAAAYLPARRAACIDPMTALRAE